MAEFLHGAGIVCLYFAVAASSILFLRSRIRIPNELFRKTLHSLLLISYIPFLFAFETWWKSVLLALILEVLIYPCLAIAGRHPRFSSFVNERNKGEFKHSLLLAFTMLAVSTTICWGLMGDRYLTLACMYAWGVGDAFAALIGKRFGKHKITWRFADQRKSIEGSLAMFATSAVAILIVLVFRGDLPFIGYLVVPVVGAAVATLVELVSKNGMDTVFCPMAAMLAMIPLMALCGGFA